MILCVGTTPAVQRVMRFPRLTIDAVNRATVTLDGAAGKSINVAKVLRVLGEAPFATGFLGGDRGEFLRSVLGAQGIPCEFVAVAARTRECVTVIDEEAGTHTELVEESAAVTPADYERLQGVIRRRLSGCRALVLSGTLAPGGPPDFYGTCLREAAAVGGAGLVVLDAQRGALDAALAGRPGLVKPNRSELAATVGRELPDEQSVRRAMMELHERGAQRVVVTAGREATLAFDGARWWRVTPPGLAARNPIGSGDAFTAGLVSGLLRGDELGEACRRGAACGGANALTWMAGEVDREDVERLAGEVRVEELPGGVP